MISLRQKIAGTGIVLIVLGLAWWWAGWFGAFMALLACAAEAVLFLSRADILDRLPAAAAKSLRLVVTISVIAITVIGAISRIQEAGKRREEERRARAAATAYLTDVHNVRAGSDYYRGKNKVGIRPEESTGCKQAPAGWFFSEEHEGRFNRALEVRIECAVDGVGYISTTHSDYRPTSISVTNHGKEVASADIWLLPDSYDN